MAKTTALRGLLTGCLLVMAGASPALGAPTVAQMLDIYKPTFQDVPVSTPTAEEQAGCEVKLVTGTRPGSSGWILLDAKKQPVRRYYDSNGDKKIDMWSWYKDGVEVYRELDSNFNERKDQFRWLNAAGMKWGVSTQEDGKIDAWQMISAEEVGQEVFTALASNDFTRLQALFLSEAEMRALKLPAAEAQRIIGVLKGASAKFQATRAKLPQLDAKARFMRVESAAPHCTPADNNGTEQDQLRFPHRTILFESGEKEKKHDWVQTGELLKVGMAWRLLDGPAVPDHDIEKKGETDNLVLRKLYDELTALDTKAPAPLAQPQKDKTVQDYNLARAALIKKILGEVKAEEQETWTKQLLDNLSAAYQAGHEESLADLAAKREEMTTKQPGSNLAAYSAYRELWASYAAKLAGANAAKVQDEWLAKLEKFAQAYPKAEDTPDALWQLAMGSEYSGKDEEAKRWYQQIYQNFPAHVLAAKAKGSETRLGLIGQPLDLNGPQLGNGTPFNVASLKGKAVVIYYWASNVGVCERDFDTLKRLHSKYSKDMELVCVSLDDTAAAATAFLQKAQVPGIQLFQAAQGGGLNSPLATFYGINGLPHVFLIGKDGRVLNRTLQVGDLESELRKAL